MSIWFKVDLDSPHSWSSMTETSESWKCGFLVRELPRNSVDFRQFCSWRTSERRDVIDTWTDRLPSEFWAQSDGILTFSGSTSLCHISSPSLEHDLGSEVLLLGGVVAHPHLQHPLWLHHLYVLHVSRFLMEAVAYERETEEKHVMMCSGALSSYSHNEKQTQGGALSTSLTQVRVENTHTQKRNFPQQSWSFLSLKFSSSLFSRSRTELNKLPERRESQTLSGLSVPQLR